MRRRARNPTAARSERAGNRSTDPTALQAASRRLRAHQPSGSANRSSWLGNPLLRGVAACRVLRKGTRRGQAECRRFEDLSAGEFRLRLGEIQAALRIPGQSGKSGSPTALSRGSAIRCFSGLHRCVNPVPERVPRLQRLGRRLFSNRPEGFVAAAERLHEPAGHRAVFVAVETDVPVEVVAEQFEAAAGFEIQLVDDALKERREQILAAEREGRGDGAEVPASMISNVVCTNERRPARPLRRRGRRPAAGPGGAPPANRRCQACWLRTASSPGDRARSG